MNSSQFEQGQLKYLAARLKIPLSILGNVLEHVEDHYYEYSKLKLDDEGRLKTFADGTPKRREFAPSTRDLKTIQKSIKRNILDKIPLPPYVHGAVKKKSNITNAKVHQGKKFKFAADIANFFPSITTRHVYNCFLRHKFTNYQARWLTTLTTFRSCLPQGAATSPGLANLVFVPTDEKLVDLCTLNGITYSRFVDDLTFSSSQDFRHLIPEILSILRLEFRTAHRKTAYGTNLLITGIHVHNNYIDVPDDIKQNASREEGENLTSKPFTIYKENVRSTNSKKLRRKPRVDSLNVKSAET